jgi:hypothetical protein
MGFLKVTFSGITYKFECNFSPLVAVSSRDFTLVWRGYQKQTDGRTSGQTNSAYASYTTIKYACILRK